ncbi:MAG: SEC-C domain-containing protein [Verrucomicrobiota bacterium]|nr:SEC-C domain-containing protein [Verrucomicrobiota bacterium]
MSGLSVDGALKRLCVWKDEVDAEALQVLRDHWEEAVPILINEIVAAEPIDPENEEVMAPLFFAAVFLCGEMGEERALEPFLSLCNEEGSDNSFFYDIPSTTLGKILVRCSDGKRDRLVGFFEDRSNSDYARIVAYRGLEHCCLNGLWDEAGFKGWLAGKIESLEGESKFLCSFLLTQGLYFIPEIAREAGTPYFESGQGDELQGELFNLLVQRSDEENIPDNWANSNPLGAADEEMTALFEIDREDGGMEASGLLAKPEQVLDILEEVDLDLEYQMVERPDVRRNALCPCGSGKKFKKCCIDKDFVRVPEFLVTWKDTLVRDDDLFASQVMRAVFLHHERGNTQEAVIAGTLIVFLLEGRVHSGITRPDDVEAQGLFVGYESVSSCIMLFLVEVATLLLQGDSLGMIAERGIRWVADQFPDASLDLRKKMLVARALVNSWTDEHYDQALADLRQVLEWDPKYTVTALILAEHYQNHPSNPDPAVARQILLARLEQGFDSDEERGMVQRNLDALDNEPDA